jgi:hypothetical protein
MIAALLRLLALRPLLVITIFGIPLLLLAAVGLLTIVVLKVLVFVVLPIVVVIWLVRRFCGSNGESEH